MANASWKQVLFYLRPSTMKDVKYIVERYEYNSASSFIRTAIKALIKFHTDGKYDPNTSTNNDESRGSVDETLRQTSL